MDIIKKLRDNSDLSDLLYDICDVCILPDFVQPQNENGHITYNFLGKTFAKAASGSEFILLEDGSVGYWGSEGESGRISDSLEEFFKLIIQCPFWGECIYESAYQDAATLRELAMDELQEYIEMASEGEDMDFDLFSCQKELSESLNISLGEDVSDVLIRFYHSANRELKFILTCIEDDGSSHNSSGSLFL